MSESLRASHQASGRPIRASTRVVVSASWMVVVMTAHSTLIVLAPRFSVPEGSPIASSAIGPPPNRCNGADRRLGGDSLARRAAARWGHERFHQQQQNPSTAAPCDRLGMRDECRFGGSREGVLIGYTHIWGEHDGMRVR